MSEDFVELHEGKSFLPDPILRMPRAVFYFAQKYSNLYGEWVWNSLYGWVWRPWSLHDWVFGNYYYWNSWAYGLGFYPRHVANRAGVSVIYSSRNNEIRCPELGLSSGNVRGHNNMVYRTGISYSGSSSGPGSVSGGGSSGGGGGGGSTGASGGSSSSSGHSSSGASGGGRSGGGASKK